MFADGKEGIPKGMVHAVQVWPAKNTPSLLDGRWHHVAAVRRWRQPQGATLELWVDGSMIATTDIPKRTNMRVFWDRPAHPDDPKELGGWALGAEVMTAWNYAFTQFEDYKGLVDELRLWDRALTQDEVRDAAAGRSRGANKGLLAHFPFDEGAGAVARDRVDPSLTIQLHRWLPANWSSEGAPGSERR
jgi:hypothetical protein